MLELVQEFIVILVLVAHLVNVDFNMNLRVAEFFAGAARVAKIATLKGLKARALDISYSKDKPRMMDINSAAGYLLNQFASKRLTFCSCGRVLYIKVRVLH